MIEQKIPNDDFIILLRDVLETNDRIVKQNSLIVQALTMPMLLVKVDPVSRPEDSFWSGK